MPWPCWGSSHGSSFRDTRFTDRPRAAPCWRRSAARSRPDHRRAARRLRLGRSALANVSCSMGRGSRACFSRATSPALPLLHGNSGSRRRGRRPICDEGSWNLEAALSTHRVNETSKVAVPASCRHASRQQANLGDPVPRAKLRASSRMSRSRRLGQSRRGSTQTFRRVAALGRRSPSSGPGAPSYQEPPLGPNSSARGRHAAVARLRGKVENLIDFRAAAISC